METNQFEQFNQVGNPATIGVLGIAPTAAPVQAGEVTEVTSLRPQNLINRDATRYVVMAGDLMTEAVKQNFKSIEGGQLGGAWFPVTEIPCLWRFHGLVSRGRITPVTNKPVQAWQDETIAKKKSTDIAEIRMSEGLKPANAPMFDNVGNRLNYTPNVYRTEFAYDSLRSILDADRSPYANQGFVEVAALEGVDWAAQTVQDIQRFLFKNWDALVAGTEKMPFLLREFVAHIQTRRRATNETAIINVADAFLESADKFRGYAERTVETAKRLAARSVNDKGFATEISLYARFLAAQCEIEVEAPSVARTISMMGTQPVAPVTGKETMSAEEMSLKERELALREEELLIEKIKLGLAPNPAAIEVPLPPSNVPVLVDNAVKIEVPPTTEIVIDQVKNKPKAK